MFHCRCGHSSHANSLTSAYCYAINATRESDLMIIHDHTISRITPASYSIVRKYQVYSYDDTSSLCANIHARRLPKRLFRDATSLLR